MKNISAIILAKNAENLIADCIDSVRFCNEVIVINNNSTDRTRDLAKSFHAKVFDDDATDFSKLRNLGKEKATGEWLFYIDADERVSPELAKSIQNVVEEDTVYAAYFVTRQNFYFGNHPWPKQEKLERLFQKNKLKEWYGMLHESPKVSGKIGMLDGLLFHYTHRDVGSMLEKTIVWSEVEAKLRFKANHPQMTWWRFFRVIVTGFYDSYITQEGYKAGTVGLIEGLYQAFSMFITYARLWEMQQKQTRLE